MTNKLIPLHVHTDASMLDSILKIDDYINWAKDNEITSIGITDHGVIYNTLEFYEKCHKNNIKPLMGCEFYLTNNRHDKERDNHHILLYAMDFDGWKNILKLIHYSNLEENYYYKNRINYELLKKYSSSLICLSACMGGHFQQLFLENKPFEAEEIILKHKKIFGDRYYLELQEHFIEEQRDLNKFIIQMSQKHNIPMVITTDAHMASKEYEKAHEILLCKNTNAKMSDEKRFKFNGEGYYLQTSEDILQRFDWLDKNIVLDCINNTNIVSDRCNVEIKYDNYHMPEIKIDGIEDNKKYLTEISVNGLKKVLKNIPKEKHREYVDRLKYEIKLMSDLKFIDYMLILNDVYDFCRKNNILYNFSRGSGTASLLLYCIGVTMVDPIKHYLPMSRFINFSRTTICDFDMDIEDARRDEVIQYVRNKYGSDKVCSIIAFGTLQAKGAIKAVASAMDFSFEKSNKLTNIMTLNASIDENLKDNNEFIEYYNNDIELKYIIDIAKKIEGIKSSVSVHPSGVIISNIPLIDIAPTVKTKEFYACTFDMGIIEPVLKLVKFDFLGLSTLTIVKNTFDRLKRRDVNVSFDTINYEDKNVFESLYTESSSMVFQFESPLMSKLLKDVKPQDIDDLSVVNAIARPASLSCGLTQEYIECRQGKKEPQYLIPELEEPMKSTYGLCIFQEGLMTMADKMSGLGMEFSDNVRVACAKKKHDKIAEIQVKFNEGCKNMGRPEELIKKCFEIIEVSSSYGFSSCHSVAYSYLSYVTAYLKYYYPSEFICSVLNNSQDNDDKKLKYIAECFQKGIQVIPPKINNSTNEFELNEDKDIVFGLTAIKGIGEGVVKSILKERDKAPFKSFIDFCERTKSNKKTLTALLESNCFSDIEPYPKKWLKYIDSVCSAISDYKTDETQNLYELILTEIAKTLVKNNAEINKIEMQISDTRSEIKSLDSQRAKEHKKIVEKKCPIAKQNKADIISQIKSLEEKIKPLKERIQSISNDLKPSAERELINASEDFTKTELKQQELQYLAYNITTNPQFIFQKYEKCFDYTPLNEISMADGGESFVTIGEITSYRQINTKNGKQMAFATISSNGQNISLTIFPEQYKTIHFKQGDFVQLEGKVQENRDKSFDDFCIIVNKCNVLNAIMNEDIYEIDISEYTQAQINKLKKMLDLLGKACYNNSMNFNKILSIKKNGKIIIMHSKYWVGNEYVFENMLANEVL